MKDPIARFLDKVWCVRAEKLIAALPLGRIDLVLNDPLWGVGTKYQWGREASKPGPHWDYLGPIYDSWFPLLKPTGHSVCFQATNYLNYYPQWFGDHEIFFLLKRIKGGCRWQWKPDFGVVQTAQRTRPQLKTNVCMVDYHPIEDYIPHLCFKPLKGIMFLIEMLTKPGDIVFDPFCGSGTVALACQLLGRHFIVGDMWPPYCRMTLERLYHAKHFNASPYGSRDPAGKPRAYYYRNGKVAHWR